MLIKCGDCEEPLILPENLEEDEIIGCSICGLDYILREGELVELVIEGEDWGE